MPPHANACPLLSRLGTKINGYYARAYVLILITEHHAKTTTTWCINTIPGLLMLAILSSNHPIPIFATAHLPQDPPCNQTSHNMLRRKGLDEVLPISYDNFQSPEICLISKATSRWDLEQPPLVVKECLASQSLALFCHRRQLDHLKVFHFLYPISSSLFLSSWPPKPLPFNPSPCWL